MADSEQNNSEQEDFTKEDLEKEISKILKNADLAKTSTKKVIQQLEKKLGADLKDKKDIIDQLVMKYVNSKESGDEEDGEAAEDDESEEDEEEEEKKKPAKRGASKKDAEEKAKREKDAKKKRKSYKSKDASNEDEDSDEEEKPAKKKGRKKKGSDGDSDSDWGKKEKAKAKKAGGKGKRGKGGGYTRAYKLSPALAELMGEDEMARHEVVKRVWEIIKEKKLYDPNNKQFAICDDALYKVFGTKRFRTFGMMKYLKSHFIDE